GSDRHAHRGGRVRARARRRHAGRAARRGAPARWVEQGRARTRELALAGPPAGADAGRPAAGLLPRRGELGDERPPAEAAAGRDGGAPPIPPAPGGGFALVAPLAVAPRRRCAAGSARRAGAVASERRGSRPAEPDGGGPDAGRHSIPPASGLPRL